MPTTVLLAHPDPSVFQALDAAFEAVSGIEICGLARGRVEAVRAAERLDPDVAVVADIIDGGSGVVLIEGILHSRPLTRCVLMTTGRYPIVTRNAVMAGVCGIVDPREDPELLAFDLLRAAAGHSLIS